MSDQREPFVPVEDGARPSERSLADADAAARAEVRPCGHCGKDVTIGERVSRLTEAGEEWRHPTPECSA